jgi:uracil-DNA glycosylase family 4
MSSALPRDAALSLLRWYAQMGVDVALSEEPVDRLAPASPIPASSLAISTAGVLEAEVNGEEAPLVERRAARVEIAPAPALLTTNPDAVVLAARQEAASAPSLDALRAILEGFEGCALRSTATRLVFGDGSPSARVMLVGEAPGREEDLEGRPFVGRSGQLLDRMLAAIGLDRGGAYIANLVPWRPPGNRTPTPQEAAVCKPFLERQIELVDPEILVCLGAPSAQALLGAKDGILKLRGRCMTYEAGGRRIRAMATLHPAYLLRQPVQKRFAWRDFRAIASALETRTPPERS